MGRAVDGVEDTLEAALRAELFRAMEPVRMLPQMLPQLGAGNGALQQLVLNEERIAGLVGQEVRVAVAEAVDARLAAVRALEAPPEAALAAEQWRALGKRLTGIEQLLQVWLSIVLCLHVYAAIASSIMVYMA